MGTMVPGKKLLLWSILVVESCDFEVGSIFQKGSHDIYKMTYGVKKTWIAVWGDIFR